MLHFKNHNFKTIKLQSAHNRRIASSSNVTNFTLLLSATLPPFEAWTHLCASISQLEEQLKRNELSTFRVNWLLTFE
ncbi:MAG: hypothetical protein ACTS5F_01440 [Candidatus Hodgkinia cicadicola]